MLIAGQMERVAPAATSILDLCTAPWHTSHAAFAFAFAEPASVVCCARRWVRAHLQRFSHVLFTNLNTHNSRLNLSYVVLRIYKLSAIPQFDCFLPSMCTYLIITKTAFSEIGTWSRSSLNLINVILIFQFLLIDFLTISSKDSLTEITYIHNKFQRQIYLTPQFVPDHLPSRSIHWFRSNALYALPITFFIVLSHLPPCQFYIRRDSNARDKSRQNWPVPTRFVN